jgi:CxxC motif-containing protein
METKELTCIGCPLGCLVHVQMEHGEILSVTGNTCKRGDAYARKEVTAPTRIVTSSVVVKNRHACVVPVKTSQDVPKNKIFTCINELKNITVNAPVKIGDIILENVANTNISIVATKNID